MHTPLQKVLSEPPYTALVEAAPSRVVGVNLTPLPPSLFHILLPSQGQQAPVFPLRTAEYQDRRHSSQEFQRKACRRGPRSQARISLSPGLSRSDAVLYCLSGEISCCFF
ncbi:unnamed protein product [Leuciscus chuanchicus]